VEEHSEEQTKRTVVKIGGSIEQSLKGDYQLDVAAILKEAWQLTKKTRVAINLGILFSLIIGMLASSFASSFLGGIEAVMKDPQAFMLINILMTILIWPFLAGVEMMGVFNAVGLNSNFKLTFAFLKRGSWVAVCALLTSLLISLGFSLFIIPGVFLAVSLSLTIPLVVEKRMSPLQAIKLCIQTTRFQWFKIFSLYFVLIMLLVGAMLPMALIGESSLSIIGLMIFFLGLPYIVPLFYNVKGILSREIFGMQMVAVNGQPPTSDDVFSA